LNNFELAEILLDDGKYQVNFLNNQKYGQGILSNFNRGGFEFLSASGNFDSGFIDRYCDETLKKWY
jgi:hypothetical protein